MSSPTDHRAGALPKRLRVIARIVTMLSCVGALPTPAWAQPCDGLPASSASTAEDFVHLADCYQRSGETVRALDALQEALSRFGDDPQNASATITIRGRLGQVYSALGEYPAAIQQLEAGIDAAAAAGRSADAAPLLNDLGRAYMSTDEPLLGVAAFADGSRLAAQNPVLRLTANLNLLRALTEAGWQDDIVGRLREIGAATSTLETSASKVSILLAVADLYGDHASDSPDARAAHQRANDTARLALEQAQALGDQRLLSYAYGQLGATYLDLGSPQEALTATRQAVLIAQTAGANDSLYRWEWQAARVLRRLGREQEALSAYRQAIDTLAKTQAWIVPSKRGFRQDVLPLYEQYADLMLADARELPAAQVPAALQQVQQTLERLRVAEVRNYFENQCAVPEVFETPAAQPENVVVIYPMLFADRTELLVSAAGKLHQYTAHVPLSELTTEVRELRELIEDPTSSDAYLEHAQRLYDLLIRPLEPILTETAPDTLVFVPDGPLRTIPLGVLNDGKRFLVERYALATTPGLSLIGAATAEPVTRALVNGIIQPVQGFPGLPFVAQELENIEKIVPSRVYTDAGFVTATLEKEILDGGYSIVHLATHARFEADYRRSFLLTHDNVITMDELEDIMSSQRFSEHPVDLLVLSACQTAAGDERAALGLAGVAVKAGARSALASLWFVNDESTALLISEFYRQLASPGRSKAAALRGAQLLLLNDERYNHPAYWAPFLMIGNWR